MRRLIVFSLVEYTVHGTLNGTPVDLNASSPPIEMTA
jgi:hypothetical protein